MKAVQIGAGNIGRGFLGQLYFESGYETTFIDANPELVRLLNERGRYPVEIVEPLHMVWVENFRAVLAGTEEAVQAITEADIASTAVGANVLPKIVPMLATALQRRTRPLDIILAENLHEAAQHVRQWLGNVPVGLVEASIGRMVPVMTDAQRREDPLKIRVEAYGELPVDAQAFVNPLPKIKNLQPRENFAAYVERKLYLHNAGHAAAAYLGAERGYEFIWQAMEDPAVHKVVQGAMDESCLGLHRRHGLDLDELQEHAADLRRRFASRPLADQIRRVAADPWRKLAADDRLLGAIAMCLEQGVDPDDLARVARAALAYHADGDPSSDRVREAVQRQGLARGLATIAGLPEDSRVVGVVCT